LATRHGWKNVRLIHQDAAELDLQDRVDAVFFSLSYSVLPDRDTVLLKTWERTPGFQTTVLGGC
jgi:ubiquinone/menaquinone biosynthesis C-methylase UbiE